ncbi:hypothetical protein HPB47_012076 [Ixodes persulcatus]|uniref:Uncharacterized protein n=1 Tax=Ixodes persulcatus TaxID=34615 RepID=A0AC60NUG6_IXOPE|nr:hypothetical protein HPB47_012076 [Ixodes persulcatus]
MNHRIAVDLSAQRPPTWRAEIPEANGADPAGSAVVQRTATRLQTLTALNSLKVSEVLEKLCQECIIQVRSNDRLNLIAVDVRNGQAAKSKLSTAMLCAVPGVIQSIDAEITEDEIARNLRAEDTCCKIANVRRLGRSRVVKIAFISPKLPSYVLLGHVVIQFHRSQKDRYNDTIVTDLATRKSSANVRRPDAVVGNTMTGRVLNVSPRQ